MKKGIIEGFYGIPWTFDERKSMINFLAEIGMDQYIYAPKDDPYHNKKCVSLTQQKKVRKSRPSQT